MFSLDCLPTFRGSELNCLCMCIDNSTIQDANWSNGWQHSHAGSLEVASLEKPLQACASVVDLESTEPGRSRTFRNINTSRKPFHGQISFCIRRNSLSLRISTSHNHSGVLPSWNLRQCERYSLSLSRKVCAFSQPELDAVLTWSCQQSIWNIVFRDQRDPR